MVRGGMEGCRLTITGTSTNWTPRRSRILSSRRHQPQSRRTNQALRRLRRRTEGSFLQAFSLVRVSVWLCRIRRKRDGRYAEIDPVGAVRIFRRGQIDLAQRNFAILLIENGE